MTPKQKTGHYALLFLAMVAGAATLLPFPPASEPSILGYRALCTFSPISTVLLFYGGLLIFGKIKRG